MELCNRSSRQLVVVLGVVLTVLLFAVRTSYYVVQLPQQLPSLDHKKPPKEWRVVATNTALILPDTKYSKLNITYERVFLPEDRSDVFVSVRTTVPFHKSRLMLLLYTWLQTIDPKQVHIITESLNDSYINAAKAQGFNVVISKCAILHNRLPLCCKTGQEFEQYYKAVEAGQRYRWYCHFDDDEYVNVPVLMRTLRVHKDKVYLGHWPSEMPRRQKKVVLKSKKFPEHKHSSFYYATGAAYCINSVLMSQLERYVRGSNTFVPTCAKLHLPDDMAVGAIIEAILGYNLTEMSTMLSQYNTTVTDHTTLKNQITIGYKNMRHEHKRVTISGGAFTKRQDPTGFLAYHCLLYPSTSWCRRHTKKQKSSSRQ